MSTKRNVIDILFSYSFAIIQNICDKFVLCLLPYQNNVVIKSIASNHHNPSIRKKAFELLGATIGKGTHFNPGILIVNDYPDLKLLVIGENVSIAPGVIFLCNSGPNPKSPLATNNRYVKSKLIKKAPIIISDDVWIGAGVIIFPGVTIGKGAIIGAGTVLIKDIPEYSTVAGVPGRVIRNIMEFNEIL